MSFSESNGKTPKLIVLRAVNVEPRNGDTCIDQKFKHNYLEALFFSGFGTMTFKQVSAFMWGGGDVVVIVFCFFLIKCIHYILF